MRLLPTAVVLAALAITTPAHAAPGVFAGAMQVDCFGCGASHANGTFLFLPATPANGEFAVHAPPSTCPASWQFDGTISGGRNAVVNVTVVGMAFVLTAVGDFTIGGGTVIPSGGVPCGGPATFTVAGWVA